MGCAANPGNPAEVQRYTQECLNHDACNQATNPWDPWGLYPSCSGALAAAAEGYCFAPGCPDLCVDNMLNGVQTRRGLIGRSLMALRASSTVPARGRGSCRRQRDLGDGMKVALLGRHPRRWPVARLQGADRQAPAG
jgi:hypothetical protein